MRRRSRKWTVNLVTRRVLKPTPPYRVAPVVPPWFTRVGSVEGHSWREAQRRALRKYGHLPQNRNEYICVSVQPYEPTSWERILADEPTDSPARTSS
jgi:hypothetical protein